MLDGYFSKRYKLRPQSCGFTYEFVPESARAGLCQILDNYFQDGALSANQLYFNISHALTIPQEDAHLKSANLPRDVRKAVVNSIMECEWWQFYDICEVIPRSLNPCFNDGVKADFYEKVNILFEIENLGFKITDDGLVEKTDTNFIDASIKKARYLLTDPAFKEAGELLEGLLQEAYSKTQPDFDKCVNDALLAIESGARTVDNSDKKLSSFDEVIEDITEKGIIPQQIAKVVRNIYISVGDHQRRDYGRHEYAEIGFDEAEFVLAITAAVITYLVSKSRPSEKAPDLSDDKFVTEYQPIVRG